LYDRKFALPSAALPPEHSGTLAALGKSISAVESQISGIDAQP
jgi:hypothetical protein